MIATLLLGLTTLATSQQTPPVTDAALLKTAFEKAKACADATVTGNYETLADLTHPATVKLAGGREAMIKKIREETDKMKAQGVAFDSSTVSAPKTLVRADSGVFCIVPMTVTMTVPKAKITANSFLLGVSTDGGLTWTFADGSPGEKRLRSLLPEIPQDLKFPAPEKPKIEKTESDK